MLFSPTLLADDPTAPREAAGGAKEKFTVAYVEGGPYGDYHMTLLGLVFGLEKLGLIGVVESPNSVKADSRMLWNWLCDNANSDRLVFKPEHFYSADWDDSKYPVIKRQILSQVERGEIDLILAFGTVAGELMATDEHHTPVLSITATDPVAAGLSETVEYSGKDHVHVQVLAGQIERQLTMFHTVFGFKTLGVPFDITGAGQSSMGAQTIERVAKELGFELVTCETELEISEREAAFRNLVGCLNTLSRKSEAIYLTVSNGMIESRMPEILAPIIASRLPSFSQSGPGETKLGVLMSLAADDFMSSGLFVAETLKEILSGRSPGQISQVYVAPLTMALNIKMAMAIGWNPPFKVLASVDELYTTMATPQTGAPNPRRP
ncbi:MAG: ABC transporter substrate-binding protein [Deltaproteobacteria bacterium]|nr:ABC transporter substrate-binding protein [Deltaproteobacteria bacterium]